MRQALTARTVRAVQGQQTGEPELPFVVSAAEKKHPPGEPDGRSDTQIETIS